MNDIKFLREALNLTQEQLAQTIGVSFSTVNRWEKGKSFPRKEMIKKLYSLGRKKDIKLLISKKPKAYALFAGGGGFHKGMENYFDILVATDIDREAKNTHKKNWPDIPFLEKDIRKIKSSDLYNLAGRQSPDFIFGGPPCQGFSTLGTKMSSDPRNVLFNQYVRIVDELKPKCFILENVKAFKTMYRGKFCKQVIEKFSLIGYEIFETVLNSADFGVPQFRERVIIFGTRLTKNNFAFPNPTHGLDKSLKKFNASGKAILDLADKNVEFCENHIPLNHTQTVIERYKLVPEGGKLPPPERLPENIRRKNFGNTYKRLDRDLPSLTMVPGNNAFPIHPTLNRSLTPREAARLQTFPDNHKFTGNRRKQCILVGNAVPCKLAEVLGKNIYLHIKNKLVQKENPVAIYRDSNEDKENIFVNKSLKSKPTKNGFIDLFSGAGGFTIGLSNAGWKPLLCSDFDESVTKTHENNFSKIPFIKGNLEDENVFEIISTKFKRKDIGLIVGGPPCQGFSIFGKRRFINTQGYNPHLDPRNKLVYAFLNYVKDIKPRWFLMENVAGLANLDRGLFLESLINEFKKIGYQNTEYKILNAAEYGVPQKRKRLIIIGNKTGHIIPWPKKKFFEKPESWQSGFKSVGEAINDLSDEKSLEKFTCHVPMNHKPLVIERYKYIDEGQKLNVDKLPTHLMKGYRTKKVKNYSHVFKRLHRDYAATTMVPGHNAFPIHPWLNRSLTVREAARIQTFPDEVEFYGTRQNQCIQVGNAFPPLLAEVIGNCIIKTEKNNWKPGETPSSAYYSVIENKKD